MVLVGFVQPVAGQSYTPTHFCFRVRLKTMSSFCSGAGGLYCYNKQINIITAAPVSYILATHSVTIYSI